MQCIPELVYLQCANVTPCVILYTVAAKKNATLKYVIFDPQNGELFVAKIFSIMRTLSVTIYFWNLLKSFSCLCSGLKLLVKEQNDFTFKFS